MLRPDLQPQTDSTCISRVVIFRYCVPLRTALSWMLALGDYNLSQAGFNIKVEPTGEHITLSVKVAIMGK